MRHVRGLFARYLRAAPTRSIGDKVLFRNEFFAKRRGFASSIAVRQRPHALVGQGLGMVFETEVSAVTMRAGIKI